MKPHTDRSFTVDLLSSASLHVHGDNHLASFTNVLPEQLTLEGEWEVGLVDISYPSTFTNITEGEFCFIYDINEVDAHNILRLESGLHNSFEEIITEMNRVIFKHYGSLNQTFVKIQFDTKRQSLVVSLPGERSLFRIVSDDLAQIFGHPTNIPLFGKTNYVGAPTNLERFNSINVYTDIIEPGFMGDTKVPLLRSFPTMSKIKLGHLSFDQYTRHKDFPTILCKKVTKDHMHSISVQLRDETGKLIPFFGSANTKLTLLFRRVN